MTNMQWIITKLDVAPVVGEFSNVVVSAYWQCIGTVTENDIEYSAIETSICAFSTVSTNFIPYENLTQEQIVEWCWANGVDKNAVEATVLQDIEYQINPPVVSMPLPWN